jgi:N-acetylglucosaminyldiphosphoundecaprenol N-acetyl-beta-D-mannosaminyltransferase
MIDRGKRNVLGIGVSVVDYEAAVDRIIDAGRNRRTCGVSALAVHGVMTGALDRAHKYRLNRLDIVTPDGQPVRWALRFLYGEKLPDRVYGPDLTLRVCERAAREGLAIYLYGSSEDVQRKLAANLKRRCPDLRIVGSEPSAFRRLSDEESAELDERIDKSEASIVFVGLGCPRQEIWVYEHVTTLRRPVIAVGAAFDFHAGLLSQAPKWMQDRGLEWLYRLGAEPRRLWRRYVIFNPLYCVMLAAQKMRLLDLLARGEKIPDAKMNYG